MNLTEKVAYIKGLTDGLKLDDNKDEVKVLKAITDLLEDLALTVADLEDAADETTELLDVLDEDCLLYTSCVDDNTIKLFPSLLDGVNQIPLMVGLINGTIQTQFSSFCGNLLINTLKAFFSINPSFTYANQVDVWPMDDNNFFLHV